jgi:hypothetical protein
MNRRRYLVSVGAAVGSLAGCVDRFSGGDASPTDSVTATPRPGQVSVEYVLRAGQIPDDVAHVNVDLAVYLAERPDDIESCTAGAPLSDNRYDPTPTPLPTPAGQCTSFTVDEVDVAALDSPRLLGPFEASATYSGGHTLVVHDVTVVLDDGTTVSDVYDTDFRAVTERATPAGTYGVEIGVSDVGESDHSWRYEVGVVRFDPTEG